MVNWGWGDVFIYDFIRDVVKDKYIWYSVGTISLQLKQNPKENQRGSVRMVFHRNIMTTPCLIFPKRRGCPKVDRVGENLAYKEK